MTVENDLAAIAASIGALEQRFIPSASRGMHLKPEDAAEFQGLLLEGKSMLDSHFGMFNDYSSALSSIQISLTVHRLASQQDVHNARATITAGLKVLQRRLAPPRAIGTAPAKTQTYVDSTRLSELRRVKSADFDLTRLVRLCEELNVAAENDSLMSVAMLVRAIVDHVPPIFGHTSFSQVANNYKGGGRSFSGSMKHLDSGLRNVADGHLHQQIRKSETLPTPSQVDFRAPLDVLLGEIVRVLK